MTWMDGAKRIIAEIDAALPADADLKTRKRALRENAWRLHQGTSWGKKVWSKAVRTYLVPYGPKSDADCMCPNVKHNLTTVQSS